MAGKVIKIERLSPRDGAVEEPELSAKGYWLGDPKFGAEKHHAKNPVFAKTLDEVAELVSAGFSLRMVGNGKRASTCFSEELAHCSRLVGSRYCRRELGPARGRICRTLSG